MTGGLGQAVDGIDFGNRQVPGEVHGIKFEDLNNDGAIDPETERGLFTIVVPQGQYFVEEGPPPSGPRE